MTGKTMTDKEKADCLLELHKVQMDHLMQTRDIEFKVNVALWTLIALSGSFLYGRIHLSDLLDWVFYGTIMLIVFFGHVVLWVMPVQNSTDRDNHFIKKYRHAVEELVGVSIPEPEWQRSPKFLWIVVERLRPSGWSWILAEAGITLVLLVGIGLLLSIGQSPP